MASSARSLLGGARSPVYEDFADEEGEGRFPLHERRSWKFKEQNSNGILWKRAFGGLLGGYILTLALMVYIWPRGEDILQSQLTQGIFPDIPDRIVTFNSNANFYPPLINMSLSQDQLFDSLQPKGKGFISIPNPSLYGLSGGIPSSTHPESEGYCISMFHQLHCLDGLRILLESSTENNGRPKIEGHGAMHVAHCVDYLRQSIMCAGDMSLEKSVVVDGVRTAATDGWGAEHKCKDFGAIWEWVGERGFIADG